MKLKNLIEKYSLGEADQKQLLDYVSNKFIGAKNYSGTDNDFLEKWQEIIDCAHMRTAAEALNKFVCAKRPVDFREADKIRIELYDSFAGKIPVIYIKNPEDFETFITNAIYKGIRPDNISDTGASFAFGKKTRFITLSAKPYSNVPANEIGISDAEWQEKSMIIRREHECTHYFTKCRYGLSENNLHDEIMADFFGLYEAFGFFSAEYFLKFMGIRSKYGNRLSFYVKELSWQAAGAAAEIAEISARNLQIWSHSKSFLEMTRHERLEHLCMVGLEKMLGGEI